MKRARTLDSDSELYVAKRYAPSSTKAMASPAPSTCAGLKRQRVQSDLDDESKRKHPDVDRAFSESSIGLETRGLISSMNPTNSEKDNSCDLLASSEPPRFIRRPEYGEQVKYQSADGEIYYGQVLESGPFECCVFSSHKDFVEQVFYSRLSPHLNARTERFIKELWKQGLIRVPIRGDGNCFFRSMAVGLGESPENHPKYRKMAYDYLVR